MLVIVNSLPKSGSTWFHNYVTRCLIAAGHSTVHEAVAGRPITVNHRGNPGALDGQNLCVLLDIGRDVTFAIKAHTPPNSDYLAALRDGAAKSLFLLRHPADIARSALAYGEFCRAAGWDEPYADIFTAQQAAEFIAPSIEWAEAWLARGPGFTLRYEALFADDCTVRGAAHALSPEAAPFSAAILEEMRPQNLNREERDWLRVNLTRHPELTPQVEARCADWAHRIGYSQPSWPSAVTPSAPRKDVMPAATK